MMGLEPTTFCIRQLGGPEGQPPRAVGVAARERGEVGVERGVGEELGELRVEPAPSQRGPPAVKARRSVASRSPVRSLNSGRSSLGDSKIWMSSFGGSRALIRMSRGDSRLAVVASHPASRSGSRIRSRFSRSRSQVVCATSAASACDSQ